jgi:sporulation protein YlmC with PRC-barrel domain
MCLSSLGTNNIYYKRKSLLSSQPKTIYKQFILLSISIKRGVFMVKKAIEDETKKFSKQLIGKTIVSKTGKRFGEVGDLIFETKSGELIHMVVNNPSTYTEKLELEKDKQSKLLIPFSAVIAIGDFMVIAEEDII